jgi:hypothetical protein
MLTDDPVLVGGMIGVGVLILACFWMRTREGWR